MKIAIIICLIVFSSCHLQWSQENAGRYSFDDFTIQFKRKYKDTQEYNERKKIFDYNLRKVHKINSNPMHTWKAGVNELSDQNGDGTKKLRGYYSGLALKNKRILNLKAEKSVDITDLPKSVDWRDKGVVTPAKDQVVVKCGSCWAFATVAAVESHIAIKTGKLFSFSEQQLVDCAPNDKHCGGVGGCRGSTQSLGMNYLKGVGMIDESDYNYQAKEGSCQDKSKGKSAYIDGFHQLPTNEYNSLLIAVATKGPVAISVASDDWDFYESGIYNGDCGALVNHVVVVVGYGEDTQGRKYWIIKNSYGSTWGENGYIRFQREDSESEVNCQINYSPDQGSGCEGGPKQITVCGICGMYMDSSYPIGGRLA